MHSDFIGIYGLSPHSTFAGRTEMLSLGRVSGFGSVESRQPSFPDCEAREDKLSQQSLLVFAFELRVIVADSTIMLGSTDVMVREDREAGCDSIGRGRTFPSYTYAIPGSRVTFFLAFAVQIEDAQTNVYHGMRNNSTDLVGAELKVTSPADVLEEIATHKVIIDGKLKASSSVKPSNLVWQPALQMFCNTLPCPSLSLLSHGGAIFGSSQQQSQIAL